MTKVGTLPFFPHFFYQLHMQKTGFSWNGWAFIFNFRRNSSNDPYIHWFIQKVHWFIWMFPKIGGPPVIHFNRSVPYRPSIWKGCPHFRKPPYIKYYNMLSNPISGLTGDNRLDRQGIPTSTSLDAWLPHAHQVARPEDLGMDFGDGTPKKIEILLGKCWEHPGKC